MSKKEKRSSLQTPSAMIRGALPTVSTAGGRGLEAESMSKPSACSLCRASKVKVRYNRMDGGPDCVQRFDSHFSSSLLHTHAHSTPPLPAPVRHEFPLVGFITARKSALLPTLTLTLPCPFHPISLHILTPLSSSPPPSARYVTPWPVAAVLPPLLIRPPLLTHARPHMPPPPYYPTHGANLSPLHPSSSLHFYLPT